MLPTCVHELQWAKILSHQTICSACTVTCSVCCAVLRPPPSGLQWLWCGTAPIEGWEASIISETERMSSM